MMHPRRRRRPTGQHPEPLRLRRLQLRASRPRQGGFNFAEVLFAVMILGIGFIMVAAIFPVAMVQTKATQEESASAAIARGGANYLAQQATDAILPATGNTVFPLDQAVAIKGGLILPSDNRFAWVPFYRRSGTPNANPQPDWSGNAQIYLVPVAVRASSVFDKGISPVARDAASATNPTGALPGVMIVDSTSTAVANPDGVDFIEFPADALGNFRAVASGAYVIVASTPDHPASAGPPPVTQEPPSGTAAHPLGAGARVGPILRIGSPTDSQPAASAAAGYPLRWSLAPGWDYAPQLGDYDGNGTSLKTDTSNDYPLVLANLNVFVVGRGIDPSSSTGERGANAQDVGAYTSFISIR
jgi:hypothetical protein